MDLLPIVEVDSKVKQLSGPANHAQLDAVLFNWVQPVK